MKSLTKEQLRVKITVVGRVEKGVGEGLKHFIRLFYGRDPYRQVYPAEVSQREKL